MAQVARLLNPPGPYDYLEEDRRQEMQEFEEQFLPWIRSQLREVDPYNTSPPKGNGRSKGNSLLPWNRRG